MKKPIDYILAVSIGLLLLILFEGILTFEYVFQFEKYNTIGWIVQTLLIISTVCGSIKGAEE